MPSPKTPSNGYENDIGDVLTETTPTRSVGGWTVGSKKKPPSPGDEGAWLLLRPEASEFPDWGFEDRIHLSDSYYAFIVPKVFKKYFLGSTEGVFSVIGSESYS